MLGCLHVPLNIGAIFTDVVYVRDCWFINFGDTLQDVLLNSIIVHLNLGLKTNLWKLLTRPKSRLISVKTLALVVFVLLEIKWIQTFLYGRGWVETRLPDVICLGYTWIFGIWEKLLVGYGGIFMRVVIIVSDWSLVLIVSCRTRHTTSSVRGVCFLAANLMTVCWVSWVVTDWDYWVLSIGVWFWTLSRLVSGEAEHVS